MGYLSLYVCAVMQTVCWTLGNVCRLHLELFRQFWHLTLYVTGLYEAIVLTVKAVCLLCFVILTSHLKILIHFHIGHKYFQWLVFSVQNVWISVKFMKNVFLQFCQNHVHDIRLVSLIFSSSGFSDELMKRISLHYDFKPLWRGSEACSVCRCYTLTQQTH